MGAMGSAVRGNVLVAAILAVACGRAHTSGPATPTEEAGGSAAGGGPDSGAPAQQGDDGGVQPPPPTPDAGATGGLPGVDGGTLMLDPAVALPVPPDPVPDDPRACTAQVLAPPDFGPEPDRPCTEESSGGTTTYRYDATGRVVYRADHSNSGYDVIYTLEDDGGVRIETTLAQGRTSTRNLTWLRGGKPVEADHFTAAADGGLVLDAHSTWLYDADGRQQYVISQVAWQARKVERYVYDAEGRAYFIDQSYYWPGATIIVGHYFTSRSWYENGTLAHEVSTCDISGGAPCGKLEKRWGPCGNLTYIADWTGLVRGSSFTDWSWDPGGRPLSRHDRSIGAGSVFDTTESYHLDGAGRAISGTIVTTTDATWLPPPEQREASYTYDDAGRLVEASQDGRIYFQARFDEAGRLIERTSAGGTIRWTYDGCGH